MNVPRAASAASATPGPRRKGRPRRARTGRVAVGRLARTAPVFAALGDATRLQLVSRLRGEGPLSIARLTEGAAISRQAVTKHLKSLEHAGLVRSGRSGRESVWALDPARFSDARQYLDAVAAHWDDALNRLKAFVEGDLADADPSPDKAGRGR